MRLKLQKCSFDAYLMNERIKPPLPQGLAGPPIPSLPALFLETFLTAVLAKRQSSQLHLQCKGRL